MQDLDDLVAGFRRFQHRYFTENRTLYEHLTRAGQSPKALVIACCDARVDPAIITDCDPGDLFVVRNVANLVPPCESTGHYHGTSAALEFAVQFLRVRRVIVLGHAQCGGVRALLGMLGSATDVGQFIAPWMSIAEEARRQTLADLPGAPTDAHARVCEQAAIRVSLQNLASFPFVQAAVDAGALTLHGWYFDIHRGALLGYNPARGAFEPLVDGVDADHAPVRRQHP